ncbi:hypothetical protein WEI85_35675 [Actinomycetes bacterium KLBMP 9797]
MRITKLTALALLAATAVAVPATPVAAGGTGDRGDVVHSVPVPELSLDPAGVEDLLTPLGVYVPEARRGVDAYRISYRTVDVRGRRTTASTLVVLPRGADRTLRPAVWLHGTQSYRMDAPSVSECCDRAAGVLFASLGYATTVPDYLGLGEGPGTHPYLHSATMASATVDALRATRALAGRAGRRVGGPVSVSGFSQGANASFHVARALQRGAAPGFTLGALAPISGAYELFDTEWPAALDSAVQPPRLAAYYLAYVTVAWNRIYHLYGDEAEVFQAPYAGRVAALFDGEHTIEESMAGLAGSPAELFRPEYLAQLRQPTGALARAARLNDDACRGWRPAVPVRMYAGHGDPEAVYANSTGCLASLRAAGTDVTLTDVGDVDHITSLVLSVPQVARWFATLA